MFLTGRIDQAAATPLCLGAPGVFRALLEEFNLPRGASDARREGLRTTQDVPDPDKTSADTVKVGVQRAPGSSGSLETGAVA
jgi:hypothetical protein